MSIDNRTIYVAEPGSEAEAIYNEHMRQKRQQAKAIKDLAKATPTANQKGHWGTVDRPFTALLSENEDAVAGWKKKKERDGTITMRPNKRLKVGKEHAKEMARINAICDYQRTASSFFKGETWHMDEPNPYGTGFLMTRPTFGMTKKKKIVVMVHKGCKKAKPVNGLKKIKTSEYYELEGD